MKHKILITILALTTIANVFAADTSNWEKGPNKSWMLTVEDALVKAKKTKKKVYVLRTGSDWCGFCIRLKKEVFDHKSFQSYARRNLILVYLDSPRKKQLPPEQEQYNKETAAKYKFGGGVPSAILLDSDGSVIAKIGGYNSKDGVKGYIQRIKTALSEHTKKDQ